MAVTIRDVAKAAGVSPMAVSKVLHGRGGNVRVSEIRAEHIRKIAQDLHYTPNQLARSLRGEKKKNIGLVVDVIGPIAAGSRYLALFFDGIYTACFEHGYSVTVCPRLNFDHRKFIADGRFDGILWAKFQLDPDTSAIAKSSGIKVVHLHVPPDMAPDDGNDYFCCDNYQAITLAVKHLAQLGHKRVDFIVDRLNEDCAEDLDRWSAMQKVCPEQGIECGARIVLGDESPEISEWLTSPNRPTAAVLRTENLAGMIYKEANRLGLNIPKDLSLVGFDSTEYCDLISPRLTAVYQPIEQMVRDATNILIKRIEDKPVPSRFHSYHCKLDVRASTAPPKAP